MAETHPEHEDPAASPPAAKSRRTALTPEQRRLLGTPRNLSDRTREKPPESEEPRAQNAPPAERLPAAEVPAAEPMPEDGPEPEPRFTAPPVKDRGAAALQGQAEASRQIEMRHALMVIGVIVLIIAVFWAGRKFDYMRFTIATRMNSKEADRTPEKFPGVTADQLIETGIAAEERGNWRDATDRLLEAKRKDHTIQGIFFHIGKTSYDRGDLEGADRAFDFSLKAGENVPVSNQYRGMIAMRRNDLPAAIRFLAAAAKANPFAGDFFYFWAEALRMDQRPREAIPHFEQASQRNPSPSARALCRFKIRLARIEAGDGSAVEAEISKMRETESLPVDWLMTDAAVQLRNGETQAAVKLISEARAQGVSGFYLPYANDMIFRKTAETFPEVAAALGKLPPSPF